ncbi:MAG: class B sortase [bacterium]|nr:class B sortase [bacterium]
MKKRKVLIIWASVLLIVGIYIVRDCYFTTNNTETISNTKIDEKIVEVDDKTKEVQTLQNTYNNQDIKGIVSIEGEDSFKFPIAQTTDNDFYLSHDYYRNYDKYGSIYADYRVDLDSSKKILLFGHNSSYIDTPFGNLENYYDKNYYDEHKYIYITTSNSVYKYEIFSVYVETSDFTYMNINFSNDEEWYSHITKLQSKSLYNTDVSLDKSDNILIMQTCSNNPNYKEKKKYLLVISRKVFE